jgi:hypothetical protein
MQIQSSLVELELHHVFGNVGDSKAALRSDPDNAASHAEFGARIFVSPDVVGVC